MTAVDADTVTIIWWVADDDRLSEAAALALQAADGGDGIFVSAVTLVDIWYATHKRNDALSVAQLADLDAALNDPEINIHVLPVDGRRDAFVRNLLARRRRPLLQVVDQFVVALGEEMAVAFEHHRHAGVSGSDGHLVVVGADGDPQRDRRVAEVVDTSWLEAGFADGIVPDALQKDSGTNEVAVGRTEHEPGRRALESLRFSRGRRW